MDIASVCLYNIFEIEYEVKKISLFFAQKCVLVFYYFVRNFGRKFNLLGFLIRVFKIKWRI